MDLFDHWVQILHIFQKHFFVFVTEVGVDKAAKTARKVFRGGLELGRALPESGGDNPVSEAVLVLAKAHPEPVSS